MYPKTKVLAVLVLLCAGSGMAQNTSNFYTCNSAKVELTSGQGNSVAVRVGPGHRFREIDKLGSGHRVYICDEQGDWFEIFYSGSDAPCGSSSDSGLDVRKAKGCRSGWVEKKWINVISG